MALFRKSPKERPRTHHTVSGVESVAEQQERLQRLRKDFQKYCPILYKRIEEAKKVMSEEDELPTHAELVRQLEERLHQAEEPRTFKGLWGDDEALPYNDPFIETDEEPVGESVATEGAPISLPSQDEQETIASDIEEEVPVHHESKEHEQPSHKVYFDESTRKFYILKGRNKERFDIVNAKHLYLLPNDLVSVSATSRGVYAESVTHNNTPYIAGFIEREEWEDARGEQQSRLYFSVRAPGGRRTLDKYKYPISSIPHAESAFTDRRIVLLNRQTMQVIDHPDFRSTSGAYESLKRIVLTNMGTYQYDEKSDEEKQKEQEELMWIAHTYGVTEIEHETTLDAQIEPALSKAADDAVARGEVIDLRGDEGGKRHTFYIDPEGSRDHDDALSLEEKENGWYGVGIHIADVARFVEAGGALDVQSAFRGTSVYLDDEVLRMLPSLLSEHLASLNEGQTRFAFSLLFDVKQDEDKGIRVHNIRFARTVIQVTEGLTYNQAQERLHSEDPADKGAQALRSLMHIAQDMHARKGIRQPGEDAFDSSAMDIHQMVAEFMTLKNRAAGAAYERMKRADKRKKPNLRNIQELVLGVYRTQELKSADAKKGYIQQLVRLGIVGSNDLRRGNKDVPFDSLARLARERVYRGGFYAPRVNETGELQETRPNDYVELSEETIEKYFLESFRIRKNPAGYAIKPGAHFSMGTTFSRVTSPIRRKADLDGQRRLIFLNKLQALSNEGADIAEEKAMELAREYAEDVVGLKLRDVLPNHESMTAGSLIQEIARVTKERDIETLAHDSAREWLANRSEGVIGSLHTVANLYGFLHYDDSKDREVLQFRNNDRQLLQEARNLDALWKRGEKREPKRSLEFVGDTRRNGTGAHNGLIIDLEENTTRVDKDGYVYGEIQVSYRKNKGLVWSVPSRLREQGARMQVKFKLPQGYPHPLVWCRKQNMYRPQFLVEGSIIGAEVEQGRLVFAIAKGAPYINPQASRIPERIRRQSNRNTR